METEVTRVTELQRVLEEELGPFKVEIVTDENGEFYPSLEEAVRYIEDIMKEYGTDVADAIRASSLEGEADPIELTFDWKLVNLRIDENA